MAKASNAGVGELVENPRIVPMKVIVCGLMRTGTLSLRAALREVGIHDVYHMQTLRTQPEDIPAWTRAIDAKYNNKGEFTTRDWDELLASCQATTDVPASFFGTELAAAYPDAKIIILNREPQKWYESCMGSLHEAMKSVTILDKLMIVLFDPELRNFAFFHHKIDAEVQGFNWPEKDKALTFYDKYYDEWRSEIASPPGRVLEFKVQDGWGPLCKHLGVDVPTHDVNGKKEVKPFPRLNDGAAMRRAAIVKMGQMRRRVGWKLLGWAQTAALIGLGAYVAWYRVIKNQHFGSEL